MWRRSHHPSLFAVGPIPVPSGVLGLGPPLEQLGSAFLSILLQKLLRDLASYFGDAI
jgi:hypothetical protein